MSLKTFYDPITDKIHGANKNTLSYFHEQGHQIWYKNGIEPALQMWQFYMLISSVWFLSFNTIPFAKITSIIMLFLLFISEMHAWIYAFKKYHQKIKVSNRK